MENVSKKRAVSLGIRIGVIFFMAVAVIVLAAYYVLSQNFHNLLTDYTIKLTESMVNQGVKLVEEELRNGKKEASILANSFQVPEDGASAVEFPQIFTETDLMRMLYVSQDGTTASDGRARDVRERPDIRLALSGEDSLYGPYFNEEEEYVICYSAPVRRDGEIVGALSVEKNGYRFCQLIENIRFVNSGESYIIDQNGTDIAVSRWEHLDWVTSRYNAREILEEQEDPVTRAILELEANGLRGESGVGTYYWENGLAYVVYAPVPMAGWVVLGGLREEEIAAMTQSAFFSAISGSYALPVCFAVFLLLTGLIIFWIISSMKKNAEINEKLEIIANHDSLTGLLNRRYLENDLSELWKYPVKVSVEATVFMMDIDDFKKYNDFYGHPQGDDCLRRIAEVFRSAFVGYDGNVLRYGGEEFAAAIFSLDRQSSLELGEKICRLVEAEGIPNGQGGMVTVSIGICYARTTLDASLEECLKTADMALYQAKEGGKNRAVILDPGI